MQEKVVFANLQRDGREEKSVEKKNSFKEIRKKLQGAF